MIGIFDSGVGGLTVLKALREQLPSADVVYFGDIKNAPYGSKERDELTALLVAGLKLLQERGAGKMISACNSASASLAISLFDAFEVEPDAFIEMVGPTVSALRHAEGTIAVAATPATVRSGIYESAFRMLGKEVRTIPIPELAAAIEFGAPDADVEEIVERTLKNERGIDILVLGCTHYPLAVRAFHKALPSAKIFDPAEAVALRAKRRFWPQEVGEGKTLFLVSKESKRFRAIAAGLFGERGWDIEVLE